MKNQNAGQSLFNNTERCCFKSITLLVLVVFEHFCLLCDKRTNNKDSSVLTCSYNDKANLNCRLAIVIAFKGAKLRL